MARTCLFALLVAVASIGWSGSVHAADTPVVEVWKTSSCGCCRVWVRHLQDAGFRVKVNEVTDVEPVKRRFKVPPELSSCHTAMVDGYVVEGHVPAGDIAALLRKRPAVKGIFVPGMPVGSPGMEGPDGEPYDVLAVDADGKVSVFATHKP